MDDNVGNSVVPVSDVSGGFGIVGFVIALLGFALSFFMKKSIVILLVAIVALVIGLILSVIQIIKGRTGFSVAGLVISILGILLILFFAFATFSVSSVVSDSIESQLDSSTSCLDAMSSVAIVDACKNGNLLEVDLSYTEGFVANEVGFVVDGLSVREPSSSSAPSEKFVLNLDVDVGDIVQLVPIVNGEECDSPMGKIIVAC